MGQADKERSKHGRQMGGGGGGGRGVWNRLREKVVVDGQEMHCS